MLTHDTRGSRVQKELQHGADHKNRDGKTRQSPGRECVSMVLPQGLPQPGQTVEKDHTTCNRAEQSNWGRQFAQQNDQEKRPNNGIHHREPTTARPVRRIRLALSRYKNPHRQLLIGLMRDAGGEEVGDRPNQCQSSEPAQSLWCIPDCGSRRWFDGPIDFVTLP